MQWVAPSEKDLATDALETRLLDAADQFRAKLEKSDAKGGNGHSPRRGSCLDEPAAYHAEGFLYLSAEARFDYRLIPGEAAQSEFERRTGPLRQLVETLSERTENLRRTCDLLLPRLLSGRVELETEAA